MITMLNVGRNGRLIGQHPLCTRLGRRPLRSSATVVGGTLPVTIKITNNGPSAANSAFSGLLVGNGLTVVSAPGAVR